MSMERADIEAIIQSGEFHRLVGEPEGRWLECKRGIYPLDEEKGKRELAKDVSSFANSDDGWILVGVATEGSPTRHEDVIAEITPFPRDLVNIDQYHSVLRSWLWPEPASVDIEWKETREQAGRGVIVIRVPEQPRERKPILIARTIDDAGKAQEVLFGYAERKLATSRPRTVQELHQVVRDGIQYQEQVDGRLQAIEVAMREVGDHISGAEPSVAPPPVLDFHELKGRVDQAIAQSGLLDRRIFGLLAAPAMATGLKTWSAPGKAGVAGALEKPPTVRQSGWDLRTWDTARIVAGKLRRVMVRGAKCIDLYRDGALILVVPVDQAFLTDGMRVPPGRAPVIINPLALIETTYNFLALFRLVQGDMEPSPDQTLVWADFRNLREWGPPACLPPYASGSRAQELAIEKSEKEASQSDWRKEFRIDTAESIGRSAYDIIEEIYLWFGLEVDMIPYTKEVDGRREIDVNGIRNSHP